MLFKTFLNVAQLKQIAANVDYPNGYNVTVDYWPAYLKWIRGVQRNEMLWGETHRNRNAARIGHFIIRRFPSVKFVTAENDKDGILQHYFTFVDRFYKAMFALYLTSRRSLLLLFIIKTFYNSNIITSFILSLTMAKFSYRVYAVLFRYTIVRKE